MTAAARVFAGQLFFLILYPMLKIRLAFPAELYYIKHMNIGSYVNIKIGSQIAEHAVRSNPVSEGSKAFDPNII